MRPGFYTDTSRPNRLAQEVIDNSVDEALAGFAKRIDVIIFADGISIPHLKKVLRAKAALCANLRVSLDDQFSGEQVSWQFEHGPRDYLEATIRGGDAVPTEPIADECAVQGQRARG